MTKLNILLRLLWHRRVLFQKTRRVGMLNKGIGWESQTRFRRPSMVPDSVAVSIEYLFLTAKAGHWEAVMA